MRRFAQLGALLAICGSLAGAGTAGAASFAPLPATLNTPREAPAVASLPGGRVLFTGGYSGGMLPTGEVFDPASNTFIPLTGPGSTLTTARGVAAAAPLPGGDVLIAGGYDNVVPLTSAEVFNSATGKFTQLVGPGKALNVARAGAVAAPLPDGRVLIAGGCCALTSAEVFDPTTATFTELTGPGRTLTTPRAYATATPLPGGRVLIAGGSPNGGQSQLAGAEIFDPVSNTFSALGASLGTARDLAAAAPLADGRVLIAGGESQGGAVDLPSAEIFNPATGTFSPAGATLGTPRKAAGAALLPDGRVLVAGGSRVVTALNSAEVFDPTAAPGPGPANAAPRLSGARLARKTFRVGGGSTPVAGIAKRRAPKGTTISYTLSEPATVTLKIERKLKGRKVGKRCRTLTRRNRKRRACTLYKRAGTLTRTSSTAGRKRVKFSGRIARKKLKPGSYRLTLTPRDRARKLGTARKLSFRIVR
jgi:hypothetical protein